MINIFYQQGSHASSRKDEGCNCTEGSPKDLDTEMILPDFAFFASFIFTIGEGIFTSEKFEH